MNDEQFDKNIFNISQQATDDNAMPFNEAAWQKMEQLLDNEKEKKRRFIVWWMLLLLIPIGVAMYFSTKNSSVKFITISQKNATNDSYKTQAEQNLQEKDATAKLVIGNDKLSSVATLKNDPKKENIQRSKAILNIVTTGKNEELSGDKKVSISKMKPAFGQQKIKLSGANNRTNNSVLNKDIYMLHITKQQQLQGLISLKQLKNIDNNLVVVNDKLVVKNDKIEPAIISTQVDSVVKIDFLIAKNVVVDTSNKQVVHALKKTKKSFFSKFEFNALVAADVSTVKFKSIDKISGSYGVGLSYAISKKLSIATGFVVSRKLYNADSADYKNAPVWGNPMYKLQNINANCLVYEVPLNIQYQFRQNKKNSWYAIGGLSTYFMKSEVYDYNFLWYTQTRKLSYTIDDKNNQLLSILNLAVGYRRQFSNNLSYQLTPFLKIPLTGIGEGKVALYSAGLQLSINLRR